MSRKIFLLAFLLAILISFPQAAYAKKTLPQAGVGKAAAGKRVTGGAVQGVKASVKFRGDRRAIIANFSDLDKASSVSYTLSYSQRGIREGAGGTITTSGGAASRELLFATCSSGVCRYHSGIKDAKFVVTTALKNGKKVVKTFRLRV